ncbi:matrixin family metalloprotease [Candidatus Daviesbacteria bacterium]|nr:matrixin family metalloprotease [Candidatus Daviesbacteria bacterium]
MKIVVALTLFLTAFFVWAISYPPALLANVFSYSWCDKPIRYRVDTVDPKFNLSREEFLSSTNQAAQIWNTNYEKSLFLYDHEGDLSINLIYDGRQFLTNQINQLENNVQSEKQTLKPKISEYQKLSAEFKTKIDALNNQIGYWNNQGGAPPEEYQKLVDQQQKLRQEASSLNTMADDLNLSTDQYNLEVSKLNQTISSFNETLEERPEEGIFKSPENRIEIYFNINKNELVHTLAHELGHALALPHNNNSKAIMYYKTNQNTTLSTEDIEALKEACKERSIFEPLQAYILGVID